MYTLDWGFKKIPCALYTYVLAKILQNGKSLGIQKLLSKITGMWATDKQSKVQQVEIWWTFVQRKYIPSAKTYKVDLSNIIFNYLCVDSPNSNVIFGTISYFS